VRLIISYDECRPQRHWIDGKATPLTAASIQRSSNLLLVKDGIDVNLHAPLFAAVENQMAESLLMRDDFKLDASRHNVDPIKTSAVVRFNRIDVGGCKWGPGHCKAL
jgi:hypothetical protein